MSVSPEVSAPKRDVPAMCAAGFGSKVRATGVVTVAANDRPTLLSVAGGAMAVRACASMVRCR